MPREETKAVLADEPSGPNSELGEQVCLSPTPFGDAEVEARTLCMLGEPLSLSHSPSPPVLSLVIEVLTFVSKILLLNSIFEILVYIFYYYIFIINMLGKISKDIHQLLLCN